MTTQRSRMAGVPRFKLPIWKAAAEKFVQGKGASREEQRNGKKSKVAILRDLVASDPEVRSQFIQFATELRGRNAREAAAEQGLTIATTTNTDLSDIDRMVQTLERGEKLTDEDLALPGDPEEQKIIDDILAPSKPAPTFLCEWCGGPETRVINGRHYCDRHDGKPTHPPVSYAPDPVPSVPTVHPSQISSRDSEFLTLPPNAQTSILLREARAGVPPTRGGAEYGPTEPLK